MADNQRFKKLASPPSSPGEAEFYYDTALKAMGFWDGTEWVYVANGSVTGISAGGTVDSVVAGTDIHVDDTDPANPVVSFTGTIPSASSSTPAMDSTGAAGTSSSYARGDHVHPSDTSRMLATATLHGIATANANDGDVALNNHKLTGLATPTNGGDAVTKDYVDAAILGLSPQQSVNFATAGALATYTGSGTGTLTASANGTLSVDGGSPAAGMRVLVKNQTSTLAVDNGIYTVTSAGSAGSKWVLTRATDPEGDALVWADFPGQLVPVDAGGTANGATLWLSTAAQSGTLGLTAINYTQIAAAAGGVSSVTAGDGSIVVSGTSSITVETGTLDAIAAAHPPAANWSNNSKKITNVANGTASDDAAAFGQIPTELVGSLTLKGKAFVITGSSPFTGDVLQYGGTNWQSGKITTGNLDSTLTLHAIAGANANDGDVSLNSHKLTSVTDPTSAQDAATKNYVDTAAAMDPLQAGFMGGTSSITATVNSTTGVLTFSNWPTGAVVWLPTASGLLVRNVMGSAPTGLTVSGITSSDFAYLAVTLAANTVPGGAPTVALSIGTSRTTAALAAADQRGASNNGTNVLAWDGIGKNAGGGTPWSLQAGTPASGSVIAAATGRDRRPWARGAFTRLIKSAATAGTASTTMVAVDTSTLQARVECSGVPLTFRFMGTLAVPLTAGDGIQVGIWQDGTSVDGFPSLSRGFEASGGTTVTIQVDGSFEYTTTPTPGTHLYTLTYESLSGASVNFVAGSSNPLALVVFEEVRQNANNGTA